MQAILPCKCGNIQYTVNVSPNTDFCLCLILIKLNIVVYYIFRMKIQREFDLQCDSEIYCTPLYQ